ncbi:MAG: AzlC family ABC transporter permease [Clostridiales bacterium]
MLKDDRWADFQRGCKLGIPIMLGYIPVSFTYGSIAVNGGLPPIFAILISLTNITSSGQFAATNLIFEHAALIEIIMVTLVINIRYLLMSLSLGQKLEQGMPLYQKAIFAYCMTDEVFALASMEKKRISFLFMLGLITLPVFGWIFGTILGTVAMNFISETVKNAMGIALYGMFISIIIPPAREIRAVLAVVVFSALISMAVFYLPFLDFISSGSSIIVVAILGALMGAFFFPVNHYQYQEKE